MKINIEKLLAECGRRHYTEIGINKFAKGHESFPFGPNNYIFAYPVRRNKEGWPSIWDAVDILGIGGGAKCGHTCQIVHWNTEEPAVYIKEKGKPWRKK